MFPLLFRVLTIAGSCVLAGVLTRAYLKRQAERENADLQDDAVKTPAAIQDQSAPPVQAAAAKQSAPSAAVKQSAPAAPVKESAPAAPVKESTPAAPVKESAPAAPVKESAPAAPAKNSAPVAPAAPVAEVKKAETKDAPAVKNEAAERAQIVISSSKKMLETYKQPEGLAVDLSLAHFCVDTAERLMTQSRFEEAFEKASTVGMLLGMSEMRASVESHLKEMKADSSKAEKAKAVRDILNEADRFLAEASKSFVSDEASGDDSFMSQLQSAFQKTTQAQSELKKVNV